jgi:hypothetical protein
MSLFFKILIKKRRKITGPLKHRPGKFLFVLVMPFLEQSSKMMPANTAPRSDQSAFQLPATQSVLSVCRKACWLLHSALSVMLAHSPRPRTHSEERKRNTVRLVMLADYCKGTQAPGFHAVCLPCSVPTLVILCTSAVIL